MLQSEWKRIVSEIDKAVQKGATAYKEHRERSIKENNALIETPLNSLIDHFERYRIQQHAHNEGRRRREWATIVGVFLTALFTLITAFIFYCQLFQMRIAIRHADEAARIQHSGTLAALQKAEDANRLAKDAAAQQAKDTSAALVISQKAADAALMQATQNRARIWIVISDHVTDWPAEAPSGTAYIEIAMKFAIANYGPTPAILTTSKFHLFWNIDEPDPTTENSSSLQVHETAVWPSENIGRITNLDGSAIKSVPANASKDIDQVFHFIPEGDYPTMQRKRLQFWFYAVVKYKDVYGVDRETSFYGNPFTGEPSEKYPQYNYFK